MKIPNIAMLEGFESSEKRSLGFYVVGIMLYKFALETMNACVNGIVLNRLTSGTGATWANMQGLNLVTQCIGSLLIAPLFKRYHAKSVLSTSILLMGLVALAVPILELITGGTIPGSTGSKNKETWGFFSPYFLYLIYPVLGLFHGMVELMRRVIPADIVGGDAVKLCQMDGLVHIFYEVSGTIGALLSIYWINYFGWAYALLVLPMTFTLSYVSWRQIQPRLEKIREVEQYNINNQDRTAIAKMSDGLYSYFHSVYFGAKLVTSQRALVWLLPAYTLPLILHRYLENTLFPFYTGTFLGSTNFQVILTGGSNFGELLGALLVFLFAKLVRSPIPFLRLDAVLLMLIWVLPFFPVDKSSPQSTAWMLSPLMAVISSGWAAGDVSLAAYIQSRLHDVGSENEFTTPLGAVMSFLFVTYLVGFYVLNLLMSMVRDYYVVNQKNLIELFVLIGGAFFTVAGLVTMISTFIPRNSFAWNPEPDTLDIEPPMHHSSYSKSEEVLTKDSE